MGDTALARNRCLIERQMGNINKNMSKEKRDELTRKLEEADDSPNNSDSMPRDTGQHGGTRSRRRQRNS
jgi:hypothetical protein